MKRSHSLSLAALVALLLGLVPFNALARELRSSGNEITLSAISSPTLNSPAAGATLSTFGPTLSWTNPAGARQAHLQVIPSNNDGPGVDIYFGSSVGSFQIPPPPLWYGMLPGMTYTWRVRVSDATAAVGLDDPSWSAWAQRTFRTPAVNSASIRVASPSLDAYVSTLTPVLQWSNTRSDVFYYEVQLSKDASFNTNPATATAMVYSALIHGGVTSPVNSYTVPPGFPLEDHTTYYWRLRPRVQGDGVPVAWSSSFSFRTQVAMPAFSPQGINSRIVLGQYYAWYDTDTWSSGVTADTASIPYNSDDIAAIRRHILQARQAGLDALAMSWLGPGDRTDKNLQKLLSEGAAAGLWVSITFETDKPGFDTTSKVVNGLKNIHALAAAKPNWLRSQGKPVFFFWRAEAVALAPGQTPLSAWADIRVQVDPNHQAIWIMEGLSFDLLEVFDGQFGYSVAWSNNVHYTLSSWATKVQNKAAQLGQPKIFVGTVMPGNDDTRTGRPDGYIRDRENGAFFADTWDAAIAAGSEWVNLTSFNEWIEGTQIEPAVSYGDQYLNMSKEWSDRFKSQ